jgi:hypothetical protein
MSTIPPNWLGSIIQTQGSHARAAGDKEKESGVQAERVGGERFADKLQDVIESSDRDSQVYSDAEGTGSQGRPDGGPPVEEQAAPDNTDEPPTGGLDVQA